MIKHSQIKSVADVDKFLNTLGLSLAKVKIVYTTGKFGGNYMVFYDDEDIQHAEAPND